MPPAGSPGAAGAVTVNTVRSRAKEDGVVTTTRTLAKDALSPSATALGAALGASCVFHGVVLGISLMVPWPSYTPPPAAGLPVELVELADITPVQPPHVVPTLPRWAQRDAAAVVARQRLSVRLPSPVLPEAASGSRDAEPLESEPVEQAVQEGHPLEAAVAREASPISVVAKPSPVDSAMTFAERAGESTAGPTPATRQPVPSGSAATTDPVAAIQPSSAVAPRITQSARPGGGYQVRPIYPPAARRAGAEGTTLLRVHVLTDGRIGEVQVERSAGHIALDQAAADAVRKWHFEPARSGSGTVAIWVLIPVEFRLRSGL